MDKDFAGSYSFYTAVPDNTLLIRSIAAVYNYDYLFDLILHSDGSMQVNVAMYGYPQV